MQSILAGEYSAWDCLNDFYRLESQESFSGRYVILKLKGQYDLELLASLYLRLPGMQSAEPNLSGGGGSSICAYRAGAMIEYVVDRAGGDCPAGCTTHDARAFVSTAPGVVQATGMWNSESGEPRPDWFTRACRR